jgi:hypothetical protein
LTECELSCLWIHPIARAGSRDFRFGALRDARLPWARG